MGTEIAVDFEVDQVIMKAPPDEPEKVNALLINKFQPYEPKMKNFSYEHYYVKII